MSASSSVTAEELVRALGRNKAALPAEIGTFVIFESCEAMLEGCPRELESLAFVRISEAGNVSMSGAASDDENAARSLHRALCEILLAAGPVLPPALSKLMASGPRGGQHSLRALRDELEAALVPLNRTASRRVLSRFAREASQFVDTDDVDAQLNSFIGKSPPAENDAHEPARANASRAEALRAEAGRAEAALDGLDLGGEESQYLEGTGRSSRDRISSPDVHAVHPSIRPSFAPHVSTAPARRAPEHDKLRGLHELASDLPENEGNASTSRKLFFGFALVAVAIIAVTIALSVRRERAETRAEPAPRIVEEHRPKQGGDLAVHVSLPNAQVLRFVGTAPVTVSDLPVGVAHEFVATADGHRPSRVLIPANAQWEATGEGPRFEAALQLQPADGSNATLELGPSRLDAQANAAPTRLGSVRVVAMPHGARVYQLIGFSPDVRVQDLPIDEPQELLVYREGYAPVLRALQSSDFQPAGARRVAAVDVELTKRAR